MGLVGAGGVAQTLIAPRGIAYAGGEAWSARSAGPEIAPGSAVRVVAVDGLELIVEPGDTANGEHGRGRDARMTGTAEELIHHHGTPLAIAGQAVRSGPSAVAVVGDGQAGLVRWFLDGVTQRLEERGYPVHRPNGRDAMHLDPEVRVILNAVGADDPTSFRRRSKDIFVVGLAELRAAPGRHAAGRLLAAGALALERVHPHGPRPRMAPMRTSSPWSRASTASSTMATTTPSSSAVVERLIPLAESRLVIENSFVPDLPPRAVAGRRAHRGDPSRRACGWASSTCCRRRGPSTSCSPPTSCGTSSACSGSAASRTGTPAPGMTAIASG